MADRTESEIPAWLRIVGVMIFGVCCATAFTRAFRKCPARLQHFGIGATICALSLVGRQIAVLGSCLACSA
jgi:hypothetical protein